MKDFEMRYVGSHVEVYGANGAFLFSADTLREAMEELAAATYGMSVESIRSYLASYTDEQLHDMIEEQVSGCPQHVVIVSAVVIQFGILYLYRFILHLCLGKLIKITVNAVFAIIALDFLLCEFKYVIEF